MSNFNICELNSIHEVIDKLSKRALLITPNIRMADYFKNEYNQSQIKQGNKTWESPLIFSFGSFLQNTWRQIYQQSSKQLPTLLNDFQATCLWSEVIESDHLDFFNQEGLVTNAKGAWKICQHWNIEINQHDFSYNVDSAQFFTWVNLYQQKLMALNVFDDALLIKEIIKNLNDFSFPYSQIILSGFDEIYPKMQDLFNELSGTDFFKFEISIKHNKLYQHRATTDLLEITNCINWIKAQDLQNNNIICVVPSLHLKSDQFSREFNK